MGVASRSAPLAAAGQVRFTSMGVRLEARRADRYALRRWALHLDTRRVPAAGQVRFTSMGVASRNAPRQVRFTSMGVAICGGERGT
jgi:hypothetical protein